MRITPGSLPRSCIKARSRSRQFGAAIIETVIALPILIVVILGAIQFALVYEAKATLNHAALQAARAGAVENASPNAIRGGLARGLLPLYSPSSSLAGVAATLGRIQSDLLTDSRIRILNPTREAFDDFAEEVDGVHEIPNDRLHTRSTAIGTTSGINLQDANVLRVQITYGYELKVPLVNWFISRTLLAIQRDPLDAFEQQLLRRTLLPILSTATVRMHSPARMSDWVVARADLPDVERFDADSRPPDTEDESDESSEEPGENSSAEESSDSTLADGFFGFGAGSGNGSSDGSDEGGNDSGGGGDDWVVGGGGPRDCPPTTCCTPPRSIDNAT